MAKRSAHTSPKGQRLGARIVLGRPFWRERTDGGRWPLLGVVVQFSAPRRAGRQGTARGRSEDAGRRGRALTSDGSASETGSVWSTEACGAMCSHLPYCSVATRQKRRLSVTF